MKIRDGKKPIANPYVVLREEFDDWAVLFDPDTGNGFGLNPAGVYVWKLLDGEHSIDNLLATLRRRDEGAPADAREHLVAFVDDLIERGLAGLEGEQAHNNKKQTPAPCSSTGSMRSVYEQPQLIDLRGTRAHGSCTNGSGAGTQCSIGSGANPLCQMGPAASSMCASGNGASSGCCGGSTRSATPSCSVGGAPGSPSCCSNGTGGN